MVSIKIFHWNLPYDGYLVAQLDFTFIMMIFFVFVIPNDTISRRDHMWALVNGYHVNATKTNNVIIYYNNIIILTKFGYALHTCNVSYIHIIFVINYLMQIVFLIFCKRWL